MLSIAQLREEVEAAETTASSAQTKDDAFNTIVDAAELCLQALRLTTGQAEKKAWNTRCQLLLDRAERIRSGDEPNTDKADNAISLAKTKRDSLKNPVSTRQLTTREQIILLEGSKLHGSIFPPWKEAPEAADFILREGNSQYTDEFQYRFSRVQLEIFDSWRRPVDALPVSKSIDDGVGFATGPSMIARDTVDLVQDVTTDCSFVASLCAGMARAERGHRRILSSIMFPYDKQLMEPAISRNGKYIFRLHFNGCFRKVIIDDRLPSSRSSRLLHVIDRGNPGLLWPALIEKAYLKIRGGYNISGSNSGTDIWVLTSWIPEQLFLHSDEVARQVLWDRLYKAFDYGDVLVTMGTGKLTEIEEESMGLAGEHDYAIIAMKEVDHQKLLLIKNPWARGTIWKGDATYDQRSKPLLDVKPTKNASETLPQDMPLTPGSFWMDLNDVFQSFESIYLNWNPGLFSSREDFHFSWDLSERNSHADSLRTNPQYRISTNVGDTAWLLLSRHFKSRPMVTDSNAEDSGVAANDRGYISLYAYENKGEKVFRSDGALLRGPYVDSPNTLLKVDLPADTAYTIVVSEQDLPRSITNFTLSVFSTESLVVQEAKDRYEHYTLLSGAWTQSTSGGNVNNAHYHLNPQYSVHLPQRTDVSLLLETGNENLPVHVKLLWSQGKSIISVKTRDVVGDSGEYRNGYAFAEIRNVESGWYTIICSTFDTGQLGKYSLRIGSMSKCVIDRVLGAEAGRLAFKTETASFTRGNDRLLIPLMLERITRLFITAKYNPRGRIAPDYPRSPLKLALEYGQGPTKEVLAVSGDDDFADNNIGIRTSDVDLQPRMCRTRGLWIVLERLGRQGLQQDDEHVDVEVFSDAQLQVGQWRDGYG